MKLSYFVSLTILFLFAFSLSWHWIEKSYVGFISSTVSAISPIEVDIEFELHLSPYDIDGDTLEMYLDNMEWTYPDWLALVSDPFRLTGTAPEPGEFHFPLLLSDGQLVVVDTFHLSVHYFHPRIMAIPIQQMYIGFKMLGIIKPNPIKEPAT